MEKSRRSLESAERPIMAESVTSKRASNRYSTYSASPSFSTSSSTSSGTIASGMAEIKHLTQGLDRLENKLLQQQRFVPSTAKGDELSKLALGAKVERALGRRMVDQDAVRNTKKGSRNINTTPLMDEKVKA